MNLYVIGPVTGMPGLNRAAFAEARAKLAAAGHSVRIPHDFVPPNASHETAMRMSLHWLLDNAEGLAELPGVEDSEGAMVEIAVAAACGIPCLPVDGWVELAERRGE